MARKPKKGTTQNMSETKTPRSLAERLEAARALVAKYEAQINSEAQINNVQVGDDVDFKYGKSNVGAGVRTLTGTVQAVGDTDNGRVVVILVGEGIDIKPYKVRAADITANRTAETRNAAETAPGGDPLTAE
jgi:hypothetical protein